jgi:hypothetical protein
MFQDRAMHIKTVILVPLLGVVLSFVNADEQKFSARSPSGNYSCVAVRLEQGMKIMFQPKVPSKSELLLETQRWANPRWSQSDNWFCIEDHIDGHITQLHIYNITAGANGQLIITRAWSSPNPTQYDSHWGLIRWDFEHAVVKVKHYYQQYDGLRPTHQWKDDRLTIPIR